MDIKELNTGDDKKKRKRNKQLLKSIRQQVEFYFSDANLRKDRFLKQEISQSEDRYVEVSTIASFNRMQVLCSDPGQITQALSTSELLELNGDKTQIRRKTPLGEPEHDPDDVTVYVECLPKTVDHDWLRKVFGVCGSVEYVSLPRYRTTGDAKGFAFIEFKTPEEANRACEMLNNPPEEDAGKLGRFPKTKGRRYVPIDDENRDEKRLDQGQGGEDTRSSGRKRSHDDDDNRQGNNRRHKRRHRESESSDGKPDRHKRKRQHSESSDVNSHGKKHRQESDNKPNKEPNVDDQKEREIKEGRKHESREHRTKEGKDSHCADKDKKDKSKEVSENDEKKTKEDSEKDEKKTKEVSEKDEKKTKEDSEKDEKKTKEVGEKDEKKTKEVSEKDEKKTKEVSEKDEKKTKELSEKDEKKTKEVSEKDETKTRPQDSKDKEAVSGKTARKRKHSDSESENEDCGCKKNKSSGLVEFEKSKEHSRDSIKRSEHKDDDETLKDSDSEEKGKKKRIRKKKQEKKKEKEPKENDLQLKVISKREWLDLKNKYLSLQKASLAKIKHAFRYGTGKNMAKDEIKETKVIKSSEPEFTPGVVLKIETKKPMESRQQLKDDLQAVAPVAYVDLQPGEQSGFVRCKSTEGASQIVDKYGPNETSYSITVHLLSDEDEKEYWEKLRADRNNKLNSKQKKKKKRGVDRLLYKAEKVSLSGASKGSHVHFADEDDE